MSRRAVSTWALCVCVGFAGMGAAFAADKADSRERAALRRAQQQAQQAQQEKAALEQKQQGLEEEKSKLTQEKNKLAGQIKGAQARAKAEGEKNAQLQATLDALIAEKATVDAQKTDLEQRLAALTTLQNTTARELEQTKERKVLAESTLAQRNQELARTEEKNLKLYQHGRNLIAQCHNQSMGSAVIRLEPFTGLKQVEIENILEEYRDKLDAQKHIPGMDR